jgi:Mg-chelatase subunit ChlD
LRYGLDKAALDGWDVAENLTQFNRELNNPALSEYARRLAVHAVLRRAARLVGPIRPAEKILVEPMVEPFRGELDVDRTLDNLASKELPDPRDWIVRIREEKHVPVVLMMDVSLSMSGRNLALAALAAAVLSLKVRPQDLAVVVFESTAKTIKRLHTREGTEMVVDRLLAQPARGYTNIQDALQRGWEEARRGRPRPATGLLITDGVYTVGEDPTPSAARFGRLFVLLTEDYKMNVELCHRMARVGKGDVFRVKGFDDLPSRMMDVANRVLR